MNGRQFARYIARDLMCPCGCVGREDTFVPNHRASRGMGGSKTLDRPANIIVMCSEMNGLIETHGPTAQLARDNGWKLTRSQRPTEHPFYDYHTDEWYLIDDNYGKTTYRKAA